MYELIIIFTLAHGTAVMEKHTAGPYVTLDECVQAKIRFNLAMPVAPGVEISAACLTLPADKTWWQKLIGG